MTMIRNLFFLIAALGLLAACETAPRDDGLSALEQELATIGNRVYFDFDSSTLSSSAKAVLSAQAAFLAANPSVTITVEGHCDERGTREYNLALGDRRATATRDYLVAQGVNAGRIRTISYGKERPAVVGSNASAYSKNRRAVSVIR